MGNRSLAAALAALFYVLLGFAAPARAQEDVSMDAWLTVEGGHLVIRWRTPGFDHYNIRWSANGGPPVQFERDGDKRFRYITPYHADAKYEVEIQGCRSNILAKSDCTSWETLRCGPRDPCIGPRPYPIRHSNGYCLEVNAPDQRRNGGRVQLWECNGTDQQLWTIDGGIVRSLARKCLEVHAPDLHVEGGRVQIWDCNGTVQQRWTKSGSQFRSGVGKCLYPALYLSLGKGAAPVRSQNGAPARTRRCDGRRDQRWP